MVAVTVLCLTATPCPPQTFTPKEPPVSVGLGDPIVMSVLPFHELSRPTAIAHEWKEAMGTGGITATDNSGNDVTNPTGQIDGLTKHILKINKRGTFLQVRLVYDDGLSSITDPVIQIFGRYDNTNQWQRLRNLSDLIDITLTTNTSVDVADGTFLYTDPRFNLHTIDLNATDEIIIGVKTNLSGTGVTNNAVLQAKLIGGIRTY